MKYKEIVRKITDALITKKTYLKTRKEKILISRNGLVSVCDDIINLGSMLIDMMPECFGDKMLLSSKEHPICFRCCWLSICKKECQKKK